MSSPFRSTNPLDFDAVDGIVINEQTPPPAVQGVGTGIAILVGQFERGPASLADTAGIGDILQSYGKNYNYPGLVAIVNKKFSLLRIRRVVASDAVLATKAFLATATAIITFSAKQGEGAYGNSITVKIEAGTTSGKKYTVTDTSAGAQYPAEVYDNVLVASLATTNVFLASNLITIVVNSTGSQPDNIAATALALGSDGTVADADYQDAMDDCQAQNAGNFLFLDVYNATRNAALKLHAAATQDKMVILANVQGTIRSSVVTDAVSYRDADGRIIYAWPWLKTPVNGVDTLVSPASFYASVLSQSAPNIDPADVDNIPALSGVTGIEYTPSRADYIALVKGGVSAFEYDSDLGYKIRSGVTTQIADSSKLMVFRRRMADFLENSAGKFFKLYQNKPNKRSNRNAMKGGLLGFIGRLEVDGVLPGDSEVKSGKAKLIDTESLNTDSSIAAGFCRIIWKQRIFSSNRYIVLTAEIGESVVVSST